MKIYFLFIFFFIFLYTFSQKPRDTIRQLQREKEAEQRDFKKCTELKNDFKDVSFRTLGQMIADEIIFKINKKNIIVNYNPPFSKYQGIVLLGFDDRKDYCNYLNPSYNQSDFWNEKTVKFLQRKLDFNIIPYLPFKGEFINRKTVKFNMDSNDKAILVFLKQRKSEISGHINADEGEKYYFIPAKGFRESNLNLSDRSYPEFEINFRNYLGKIVTVKYTYDEYKEVYKTFQYKNKKWIEIQTINEYKF